jgi:hypothetical protein
MKNLPSKAVLLALIKSSPSRRKRAHAVRLLSTAYAMTQHEIAMASGKSLGWVSAMLLGRRARQRAVTLRLR